MTKETSDFQERHLTLPKLQSCNRYFIGLLEMRLDLLQLCNHSQANDQDEEFVNSRKSFFSEMDGYLKHMASVFGQYYI